MGSFRQGRRPEKSFCKTVQSFFFQRNEPKKIYNQNPNLDQEIILKTYNILSEEIVLDNFLKKLIQIAMETAGATRAIYFHLYNKNLTVYLTGQSGETEIIVENFPEIDETQYPISYLNYVFRTHRIISTRELDSSLIKDFTDRYIKEKNLSL